MIILKIAYLQSFYNMIYDLIINLIIMQLTQEQLDDYKRIYKEKYWKDMSDKEALEHWIALVNLMKLLLKDNGKNN